jgi:Transposase DDE domain
VTPHVSQNTSNRRSAIDGRTTRHAGHVTSLRIRKRIEEPFGWMKTIAGGRKLRYIGLQRNRAWFLMTGAVYNLIRITALDAQAARPGGRKAPERLMASPIADQHPHQTGRLQLLAAPACPTDRRSTPC